MFTPEATRATRVDTAQTHGPPWSVYCLDNFPTQQRLQKMPFIAYGGARPSAGLGHVCSHLFNEMVPQSPPDRVAT